jgi:hypothetical protein
MKYEFDRDMDETYQKSLVKSFKKTVDDALFNFIIVDMINERLSKLEEMSLYAKQKGYHVYIGEMTDFEHRPEIFFNRNIHSRTLDEIKMVILSLIVICFTNLIFSFVLY